MSLIEIQAARLALTPPLKFGDESQIKAIRVLAAAERIAEIRSELRRIRSWCDYCDGEGVVDCTECGSERTCKRCNGNGWTSEPPEAQALHDEMRDLRRRFPGAC